MVEVKPLLQRLEELYPEHKVFALSGLDEHLRKYLAESYSQLGYPTVEDYFHAQGYEVKYI